MFVKRLAIILLLIFSSIAQANAGSKVFELGDYPRQVYCVVSKMQLVLRPDQLGAPQEGSAVIAFIQDCNSRYNQDGGGPWAFDVEMYDASGAVICKFVFPEWKHVCGRRPVQLNTNFSCGSGSFSAPVSHTANARVFWSYAETVNNCD